METKEEINRAQELNLELIELASFNEFDGEAVVKALRENRGLWRAVMMVQENRDLIPLRDLPDEHWNVDTLFILPTEGKEDELEELAHTWKADEIDWLDGKRASKRIGSWNPDMEKNDKAILSVWWD